MVTIKGLLKKNKSIHTGQDLVELSKIFGSTIKTVYNYYNSGRCPIERAELWANYYSEKRAKIKRINMEDGD